MFTLSPRGGVSADTFHFHPKQARALLATLLSNYGLIRDVGMQALVRERKTPRNLAEHLDL